MRLLDRSIFLWLSIPFIKTLWQYPQWLTMSMIILSWNRNIQDGIGYSWHRTTNRQCWTTVCQHVQKRSKLWGCVHIHTSTSPGTCIRVLVNPSLHVFQWWPHTLTQVLYEYELPVNFTRTSSFCTGRVFIQPVRCKQNKICINFICTRHFTS